jgi:hypothetical protein
MLTVCERLRDRSVHFSVNNFLLIQQLRYENVHGLKRFFCRVVSRPEVHFGTTRGEGKVGTVVDEMTAHT